MSHVNDDWLYKLLCWIDELFDCKKKPVESTPIKKTTMTLDEAKIKLAELNDAPHLGELAEIPYSVMEYMIEDNQRNYPYKHCAKNIFKTYHILSRDDEINNFSKFKCDESRTDGDKNYTVKTFYGRDYSYYRNCIEMNDNRKLRVVYYGNIQKYVLIVSNAYYDYISKTYDDLQTLKQEVLTLANILKLEKEIEEMKVKRLEEDAWG